MIGEGKVTEEDVVRSTFGSLAGWQRRVATAYQPELESDLADDDEDWPYFGTSAIAWSGLVAATDHLCAIRAHVEAHQLFPMAHLSLCRTALIGASQAVWVLAPVERRERVRRTRVVNAYLYKKHLQYLRGLQGLAEGPHIGTDIVATHVAQRLAELAQKRAAEGQNEDLNYTDMIRDAAAATFKRPDLVREVVLSWQSGSGTAHGLPWPLFGTPGTVQTKLADDTGLGHFQAGGSLSRIANSYMAAFYLAKESWKLLSDRGTFVLKK